MLNQSITITKNIKAYHQPRGMFLLLLMLMSTAGLVGSDMYLPMLPEMGKALQQNSSAMQFTLGIYLFGLSIGQLLFGPLIDRFGRRNMLILGMTLYFLASLSCALSYQYWQLLAARFLQALGACSGLIIGRAVVGDKYDAKEAGKIFATIFPFVGASPAISPLVGGLIGHYGGWESTFIFVGLYALIIVILAWFYLEETLTIERRQSLDLIKIVANYPILLMDKRFFRYVTAPCVAYIVYFAYMAQSPFIFNAYGYEERAMGSFYITLSIAYIAGNLIGKRLLNQHALNNVLQIGYIVFNLGSCLFLMSGLVQGPLWLMVLAISIATFGNGFLIPLGTAGVVSSFPHKVGYASGLLGFLQLGAAAISAAIIGWMTHNSITKLGVYMVATTVIGLLIFILLKEKQS